MPTPFHIRLQQLIDEMIHEVYRICRLFPKDELHGAVSQAKRASLSVGLNYVEGFARHRRAVNRNFLEIAYGSLKETKYLMNFAHAEGWIGEQELKPVVAHLEEIGRMFWGILARIKEK